MTGAQLCHTCCRATQARPTGMAWLLVKSGQLKTVGILEQANA